MRYDLENRVVLVTGASSGIGRACALGFHRAGAKVAAMARSEDKLQRLVEETDRTSVLAIPCDVTRSDDRAKAIETIRARWGPVDVLVNNAGWASFGSVLKTPLDHVRQMLDLNFVAAVAMIQAVLPDMLARRSGQIINMASIVGHQAIPRMSVYSATKAALLSLSTGLRMELRGSGVDVIAISPSSTRTPFFDSAAMSDTRSVRFAKTQYTPERVAAAVVRASRRRAKEVTLSAEGRAIAGIRRISHRVADAIMYRVARRAMPVVGESLSDGGTRSNV